MNADTIVYAVQKSTIIIREIQFADVRKDDCVFTTALAAIQYTNDLTREYSKHLGEYLEGKK